LANGSSLIIISVGSLDELSSDSLVFSILISSSSDDDEDVRAFLLKGSSTESELLSPLNTPVAS